MSQKKIIVALDSDNLNNTVSLVKNLKNDIYAFKIGYEFFLNFGINGYRSIQQENVKIFFDLKLHDIPNTVKSGINAITKLNPCFTTIHLSGGDEMQKAAVSVKKNTKIVGVSILTSLDSSQTKKYHYNDNLEKIVTDYTHYALINNLDGVVCSPKEIEIVRKIASDKLIIITPGIRLSGSLSVQDDQKRFMTPNEAIKCGANYLVIGRPITQSSKPLETVQKINSTLE